MDHQPLPRMPVRHGIPKGSYSQMSVHGVTYGPADHTPTEQVDEGTQVQPTLVCQYVGEIRHPRMVRQADPEILPDWLKKGVALGSDTVVCTLFRQITGTRPAASISLRTRLRLTRSPPLRNSSRILRAL